MVGEIKRVTEPLVNGVPESECSSSIDHRYLFDAIHQLLYDIDRRITELEKRLK